MGPFARPPPKPVADHGRLDALVNNAGSGHVRTIEKVSLDEVRRVMELNFFGVVATSKEAMPHLRSSGGRLITVSSVGGAVGQPSTRPTARPSSPWRGSWRAWPRWRRPSV